MGGSSGNQFFSTLDIWPYVTHFKTILIHSKHKTELLFKLKLVSHYNKYPTFSHTQIPKQIVMKCQRKKFTEQLKMRNWNWNQNKCSKIVRKHWYLSETSSKSATEEGFSESERGAKPELAIWHFGRGGELW